MLAETVTAGTPYKLARPIYTVSGTTISKPATTLTGTVIIGTLIVLQLAGLILLTWYTCHMHTGTSAFNAPAMGADRRERARS